MATALLGVKYQRWYQVGQKLAAGSTVNRGAIFEHHSKRFTILHSSSSFSTVFMYPLIQRKIQRNHTNERIKQRILNSNFGESRAVESIRANLFLSRFRYGPFDIIDFFASAPLAGWAATYGTNVMVHVRVEPATARPVTGRFARAKRNVHTDAPDSLRRKR